MTTHTFDIYSMIQQGSLKKPKDLIVIYKLRETITADTQPNITIYGYKQDAPDKSIIVPTHDLPISYDDEHENSEMVHIIKVEVDPTIIFVKALIGNIEYLERLKYIGFKADDTQLPPGCTGASGATLCDFYYVDGVDDYILCDGFDTPITGVGGKFVLDFYISRPHATYLNENICGCSVDGFDNIGTAGLYSAGLIIVGTEVYSHHNKIYFALAGAYFTSARDAILGDTDVFQKVNIVATATSYLGAITDDYGVEHLMYDYTVVVTVDGVDVPMTKNLAAKKNSTNYNWSLFAKGVRTAGVNVITPFGNNKYKEFRMTAYNDAGVKHQEVYIPCSEKPEDYTSNSVALKNRASAGNITLLLKNAGDNEDTFYQVDP